MPTFYSTDDFTSSWLAQVAAWALQVENPPRQGDFEMKPAVQTDEIAGGGGVSCWPLYTDDGAGNGDEVAKCDFCNQYAVTIAWYADGWGDIVGTHRMCKEHGAPCNHYADPYASFVREEPLNDVEAEDNQG